MIEKKEERVSTGNPERSIFMRNERVYKLTTTA